MLPEEELLRLRQEMRELRKRTSRSETSIEERDREIALLEEAVKNLMQDKKKLEAEKQELEEEIASLKAHQVKLQSMLFKANRPAPAPTTNEAKGMRKRGGQTGHKGYAHTHPQEQDIDEEKVVCLTHCPHCENVLNESDETYTRIVQDIPEAKTIVTRYTIQRQWCPQCQKEVHALPQDTLSGMHIGLRALVLICFLKYRLRTPLGKIREFLLSHHGLRLTQGGIQKILHMLAKKCIPLREQILEEIRAAPMKHADETSWRIQGQNSWCWLFATPSAALYTIEETRGKGVPQRILGPVPEGVLVRDDYPRTGLCRRSSGSNPRSRAKLGAGQVGSRNSDTWDSEEPWSSAFAKAMADKSDLGSSGPTWPVSTTQRFAKEPASLVDAGFFISDNLLQSCTESSATSGGFSHLSITPRSFPF